MSVGTALSEARARCGLSLDQVAEQTRIRRTLIENLEHDDFHACGGDFYVRGHIRSIAHVLDLDPEPLIREFDGEHPRDQVTPTASGVLDAQHDTTRRRPNWSAAMAAALVAVVGFAGYQAVAGGGGGEPTGVVVAEDDRAAGGEVAQTPDEGPSAPAGSDRGADASDASDSADSADDEVVAQAGDGVVVTLSTDTGRSWVSATGRNGKVLFEGILQPGREKTVRDTSKVALVAGNAGALELTVNGEDLGAPGTEGEVVRLTFGPGSPSSSGG